jgi:hypothetical protein
MPKVTELYAYVMADKDENDEGVPAMTVAGNVYPLMGADLPRIKSLRPFAQALANEQGKEIKLLRFSQMEIVEMVKPDGATSIEVPNE